MSNLQRSNKKKHTIIFITISVFTLLTFGILYLFIKGAILDYQRGIRLFKRQQLDPAFRFQNPSVTLSFNPPSYDITDPVKGDLKAPIVIIEFGDFTCPACKQTVSILEQVLATYPQAVKLIWKDFPLNGPDSQAGKLAQAAHCADKQGKFWEMHNLLFRYQDQIKLGEKNYEELAQELNLNLNTFRNCVNLGQTYSKVKENYEEAIKGGVDGTPFFWVGSQVINWVPDFNDFKMIIESEIQKLKQ